MNPSDLEGKRIALVLTNERGESVAFTGIAHWEGEQLYMLRNKPDPPVPILEEWYRRIRATPGNSKDALLGAEYFVMLRVGDIATGTDESEFQKIGLRWPAP